MVLPLDVPVEPAPPEATEWLIDELSKPEYNATQPGLLEIIGRAISDWFASLFDAASGGPMPFAWFLVALALVAVVVVVALLLRGLPRIQPRSRIDGGIMGEDARDAAAFRRDAATAAARGDYAAATIEMFRAIARGVAERELVAVTPGTTAREFADLAARAFPAEATALVNASAAFDAVRYLDHPGSSEAYASITALEARIRASRPMLEAVPS